MLQVRGLREEIYAIGQPEGTKSLVHVPWLILTTGQSHQNKFHTETLQVLAIRFASLREGDAMSEADRELWEYFSTLYKNSNKGIKGRGKDRRIAAVERDGKDLKQEARAGSSSSSTSP